MRMEVLPMPLSMMLRGLNRKEDKTKVALVDNISSSTVFSSNKASDCSIKSEFELVDENNINDETEDEDSQPNVDDHAVC